MFTVCTSVLHWAASFGKNDSVNVQVAGVVAGVTDTQVCGLEASS